MRNYDRVHPRKPEGIEERKAYIVGGGIAGLSAAAGIEAASNHRISAYCSFHRRPVRICVSPEIYTGLLPKYQVVEVTKDTLLYIDFQE